MFQQPMLKPEGPENLVQMLPPHFQLHALSPNRRVELQAQRMGPIPWGAGLPYAPRMVQLT
jgi:hypothetical protein